MTTTTPRPDSPSGILLPDGRPAPAREPRQWRRIARFGWVTIGVVLAILVCCGGAFWFDIGFGINVALFACTAFVACLGLTSVESRGVKVSFSVLTLAMLGLIAWQAYRDYGKTRPRIVIKDSAALNAMRRITIKRHLWHFEEHLTDIGLGVRSSFPPIEVSDSRDGAELVSRGKVGVEMALDPWESRILILRSRLSDRGALLDGYCSWVIEGQIPSVMSRIDQDRMNEPAYLKDIDQAISVQRAFAGIVLRYLVDSYMGSKRADASAWNEALWDMRSRLGSDFADRLVAAMVANMAREYLPVPPEKAFLRAGDAKAAIDLNLYRQLVRADAYVDSESANLPMMRAVLAEHGIENPWREAR